MKGVATEINADLPQSPSIVERLGEACGRAEETELECPECKEGVAEVATKVDGLFLSFAGLGQRFEELQRPLKRADGFAHGRPRACELSRSAPIADRLVGKPGLAKMVSHNFGLVLCQHRELLDQYLGDARMQLPALALEHRGVGGVLHQRMLESVDRVRRRSAPGNEARGCQPLERRVEVDGSRGRRRGNQLVGELPSEGGADQRHIFNATSLPDPNRSRRAASEACSVVGMASGGSDPSST
jgi:hypothetical protein